MNRSWPNNADGDVFRRLQDSGFDFSKEYDVDFNVDFNSWPPPLQVINAIKHRYCNVELHGDEDDEYILVKIRMRLTYDIIINTQHALTDMSQQFGGQCDSWGVFSE